MKTFGKNKSARILFGSIAALLSAQSSHSAIVSWNAPGTWSGNASADILNGSTGAYTNYVDATTTWGNNLTLNGVTFYSTPDSGGQDYLLGFTGTQSGGSVRIEQQLIYNGGPGKTGATWNRPTYGPGLATPGEYTDLIDAQKFIQITTGASAVILTGLTPGQRYQMQVWASTDFSRDGSNNLTFTTTNFDGKVLANSRVGSAYGSGSNYYNTSTSEYSAGKFMTGYFVADSTGTQTMQLTNGYALPAISLFSTASAVYWKGDIDGNWNTTTPGYNFTSDSAGTTQVASLPTASTDVIFNATGAGNLTTSLGQNFTINGLSFLNAASTPVSINGGGGVLTLNSGGVSVESASANHTINADVALGASQPWAINGSRVFTMNGVLSGTAGNALTLNASGTVVLNGANTYSGTTNITAGKLTLGNSLAAQNTTINPTVASGLAFTSATNSLASGVAIGGLSGSGNFDLKDLNAAGNVTLKIGNNNSSPAAYTGQITGTGTGGSLIKIGTGTLTFTPTTAPSLNFPHTNSADIDVQSGALLYGSGSAALTNVIADTLAVKVSGGNLNLGYWLNTSNNTLNTQSDTVAGVQLTAGSITGFGNSTLTSTTDYDVQSGLISVVLGGTVGLTKTTSGTVILANPNNSYTGSTTISGGILNVAALAAVNTNSSIGKGPAVDAASGLVINGGTLQYNGGGATSTNRSYTLSTGGGAFDASGTGTANTLTFSGNMTVLDSAGNQTLTLTGYNTGANTISGTINNGTGTNVTNVAKTGLSKWVLSNTANTYTGVTTISNGILNVGTFAALGSNSSIGKGDATSDATNAASLVLNGGVLQYSGTAAASTNRLFTIGINGGTLDASGTSAGQFTIGSAGGSILFSSSVNPASLTLTGTGTGAAGQGIFGAALLDSGTGANLTSLIKSGTGTWIFTNDNNAFTGGTTINLGTIQVGNAGATGSLGSGAVVNNGLLIFNRSGTTTFSGGISGGGALTLTANTLTLTGANTYTGTTTITAGTLNIGDGTNGSFNGGAIANAGALVFNTPNAVAVKGILNGAGSLTQSGGGTTTFTGPNNYAGTTAVSAGVLALGGTNAGTGGAITISGTGTLRALDLPAALGSAPTIALNAGTLDLRANSSVAYTTGALTLGGNAIINVQNNGTIGAGSVIQTLPGAFNAGAQTLSITGASGYGLKISGTPTLTGAATTVFDVAADPSLELSGAIAANAANITKQGNGLLILSGNNAQTGIVTLTAGTLRGTQANSFGQSAATLQLNGGTLDLRNNSSTSFGRNTTIGTGPVTINVDDNSGIIGFPTNVFPIWATNVSHTLGTLSIGASQLNVTSGTGHGAGLIFGNSTLTGATGAASVFNVASNAQLTLGALQTSTGSFDKQGSGLMLLSTAAAGNIAASTVTGGTLRLTNATALTAASGALTVNNGARLEISGVTYTGPQIILNNGATLLGISSTGVGVASGYNSASGISIPSGAAVTIGTASSPYYNMGSAFSVSAADVFTITPALLGGTGGSSITFTGLGRTILSSASSYDGSIAINSGLVELTNATGLGLVGNSVTVAGGASLAGNNVTFGNAISLGDKAALGARGNTATYSGVITLSGGTANIFAGDINDPGTARTVNISNKITGAGGATFGGDLGTGGTINLTSAVNDFSGASTIQAGSLSLSSVATLTGTSSITINPGGTLTFAASGTDTSLPNGAPVTMRAGTLTMTGTGSETVGALLADKGLNQITGASSGLTLTSLSRTAGATANFSGLVLVTGGTNNPFLGGAYTVGNNDFARYNATGGTGIVAINTYTNDPTETNYLTGTNVKVTAGTTVTLAGTRQINSLNNTNASAILNTNGNLLTLESGGIISTSNYTISGTTLGGLTAGTTASPAELFVHTTGGTTTISSAITNNGAGGVVSLVKNSTGGSLTLGGTVANTYTGTTYVNGGTLTLSKPANVNAIAGNIVINNGTLTISTNREQIADTTNVTITNQANSGVLSMVNTAGVNETINSLTVNALMANSTTLGTVVQNAGTLNLASTGSALTMIGGIISSPLTFTGAGSGVTFKVQAPTTPVAPTVDGSFVFSNGKLSASSPYMTYISGAVNLNAVATGVPQRIFDVDNGPATYDLWLTAGISSSMPAGITKEGAGTLRIQSAGTATYTGPLIINAGTVTLTSNNQIDTGIGGVVVNGGTLQFEDNNPGNINTLSTLTINAGGTVDFLSTGNQQFAQLVFNGGTILNPRGNNATANTLSLRPGTNGQFLVLNGNTLISNIAAADGGVIKTTASANTATIAGQFNLSGQKYYFNVPDGAASTDLNVTAGIIGVNGATLFKIGAGTMQLSGTDWAQQNTVTSTNIATNIFQGTLVLAKNIPGLSNVALPDSGTITIGDFAVGGANSAVVQLGGNEQIRDASPIVVTAAGKFDLNGFSETIGTLLVGQTGLPGGTVSSTVANSTVTTTGITMNGGIIDLGATGRVVLSSSGAITLNTGGVTSTINSPIAGTVGLNKSGVGNLTLGGVNTYTGVTTITTGTLKLTANNALSNVYNVNLIGTNYGVLDLSDTTQNIGSLSGTAINAMLKLGTSGSLTTGYDGTSTTFFGNLVGGTGTTFTKVGAGTLNFQSAQPLLFSGAINVNAGTLKMTAANAMPVLSSLTVAAGAIFDINNQTTTVGSLAGAGTVTNTNNAATTLTVGFNNNDATFSGAFTATTQANLNITKIGTGKLTLTGGNDNITAGILNPAMGTLTAAQGTVSYSGAGLNQFPTLKVSNNATIAVDDSASTLVNRLGGPGTTVNMNSGRLTITAGTDATASETINTLNIGPGSNVLTLTPSGSQAAQLTAYNLTHDNIGGTLLIRGTNLGNGGATDANVLLGYVPNGALVGTGSFGTPNRSIIPSIIVDTSATGLGSSFATVDAANNIRPLLASEYEASNVVSVGNNIKITGAVSGINSTLINSLTLTAGSLTLNPRQTLTLNEFVYNSSTSAGSNFGAGILSTATASIGGNNSLIVGNDTATNQYRPLNIYTAAGTLTINSGITNFLALGKSGPGTLRMEAPSAIGQNNQGSATYTVGDGSLILAGGDNTLAVRPSTTTAVSNISNDLPSLLVRSGATVDLNGTNQWVINVQSEDNGTAAPPNSGGTVTNTSGTSTISLISPGRQFSGSFSDSGGGTLNVFVSSPSQPFASASNNSGFLQVGSGTMTLKDAGAFNNIASATVAYGTLNLDNTGLQNVANRLKAAAPLNLRGGSLTLTAGVGVDATQTLNTLNLVEGASTLTATPAVLSNSTITIGRLNRSMGAVLSFAGTSLGTPFTDTNLLPLTGTGNGRIQFTSAPVLTNDIIGGWAVVGTEFASYNATTGVIALGGVAVPAYSARNLLFAGTTDNVNVVTTSTTGLSARTINSFKPATMTLDMASATDTLTIATGGIITSGFTFNVGQLTSGAPRNPLVTGPSELFVWGTGTTTFNGTVVDNGSVPVALVKNSAGTLTLTNANTYTGGTVVNTGSTLNLTGRASNTVTLGSGPLIINGGGTVTENTFGGQIPSSVALTMNGDSTLNLVGNNTLSGITFTRAGATAVAGKPQININNLSTGAFGRLTVAGDITATNDYVGSTPTITTGSTAYNNGFLDLGGAARNITVNSGLSPVGLYIASQITNATGITKLGGGTLVIGNAFNNYTGPTNISAGMLQVITTDSIPDTSAVTIAANATLNIFGVTTTSLGETIGSLAGAGTVENQSGTAITFTVGRDNTDTAFSGTINGQVRSGSYTIAQPNPSVLSFAKVGTGRLDLSGANTYAGKTTVHGGVLSLGGANGSLYAPTAFAADQLRVTGGSFVFDNSVINTTRISSELGPATNFGVSLNGGTISLIGNSGNASSQSLGEIALSATVSQSTPVSAGASTINVTNGAASGSSAVLTFNSAVSRNNQGTLNFTSSGFGTLGTAGFAPRIFLNGTADGTVLDYATVNGADIVVYGAANGIRAMVDGVGATDYAASVTALTAARYNHIKGSFLSGALSIKGLKIDDALMLTLNGILTISQNPGVLLKDDGTGLSVITGSSISPAGELIVGVAGGTLELDSIIGGSSLTKTGPGTLILGAANIYGGTTTINGGYITYKVSDALGSGPVTVNGYSSIYDIAGFSDTIGSLTISAGGSVTNSGAGANLTIGTLNLGYGGPTGATTIASVNGTNGLGKFILTSNVFYNNGSNDQSGLNNPGRATLGNIDLNGGSRNFTANHPPNASVAGASWNPAGPDLEVSGVISGVAGSSIGLSSAAGGVGIIRLSGANTFDGNVNVTTGNVLLVLNNDQALGNPTVARTVNITSNGTVAISGGRNFSNTNNQFILNGGGTANNFLMPGFTGALVNISGNSSIAGQITLGSDSTVTVLNSTDTLTLGNLAGSAGFRLTKNGLGTLSIGNAGNTFDGLFTVGNGTVALTTALGPTTSRQLNVSSGATLLLDGTTAAVGLVANNPLNLSGAGVGLGVGPNAGYGAGSGGALDSKGADNTVNGAITLPGATTITSQTATKTLTLAGAITSTVALTVDGLGNVVINGTYGSGAASLVKTGTGTLTLGAANTFTGATTIQLGTLKLGVDNAIGSSSAVTLANALSGGSDGSNVGLIKATLDINGKTVTLASITFGGATAGPGSTGEVKDSVGGGSILLNGGVTWNATGNASPATISASLDLNAGNRTFTVTHNAGNAPGAPELIVSGNIIGANATTLTKAGNGVLLLSGTNTYGAGVGSTTAISAGILRLNGGNAIPDVSQVNISGGNNSYLDLSGTSETIGSLTGNGIVLLGTSVNNSRLTMIDGTSVAFTGYIRGGVANQDSVVINKSGGTQTLSIANPFGYLGNTTITAGTLATGAVNALPFTTNLSLAATGTFSPAGNATTISSLSGAGNVTGSGTLTIGYGDSTNATAYSGAIQATENLTKIGTGTQTLTGTATSTGTLSVNNGTLSLGNATAASGVATTFATVNVFAGGKLVLDNTAGNTGAGSTTDRLTAATFNFTGGELVLKSNAANGSQETLTTFGFASNGGKIITLDAQSSSGPTVLTGSLGTPSADSAILVRGVALGTAAAGGSITNLKFSDVASDSANLNTITATIRQQFVVDTSITGNGSSLATYTNANGLRALNSNETINTITIGATNSNNVKVDASGSLSVTGTGTTSIQSLTLESGSNVNIVALDPNVSGATLTLSSDTILSKGGTLSTISGNGQLNVSGTNSRFIYTAGDLTISARMGGQTVKKSGPSTLTLTNPLSSGIVVNGGTLRLDTGVNNPLMVHIGTGNFNSTAQGVNIYDGTLDIYGSNLATGGINLNGNTQRGTGTITNTKDGTTATFGTSVAQNGSQGQIISTVFTDNWNGSTGGKLNFIIYPQGNSNEGHTLIANNTLHGTTTITGETAIMLKENGQFSNTSQVFIEFSRLLLENGQGQGGSNQPSLYNINRLNPNATITLMGGFLRANGAEGTTSTQNLGTVDLAGGSNTLSAISEAGGISVMNVTNLLAGPASNGIIQFNATATLPNDPANGSLPTYGRSHVFLSQINGTNTSLTNPDGSLSILKNGILGGWGLVGTDFASYNTTQGVAALGNNNGGYPAYSTARLDVAGATDNVNMGAAVFGVTSRTINSLKMAGFSVNMNSASDLLTIGTGGVISTGGSLFNGQMTAGTTNADAALYVNLNTSSSMTVQSRIVDNTAGGKVKLFLSGIPNSGTATYSITGDNNTYTGGTVINQPGPAGGNFFASGIAGGSTTVNLDGGPGGKTLGTGGLWINGATVNMNAFGGQIPASNVVTINGYGVLNLIGDNTFAGLNFDQRAAKQGNGNVGVFIPGNNTLTVTGDVSGYNDSVPGNGYSSTPNIGQTGSTGASGVNAYLNLTSGNHTFTVNGAAPVSLDVAAVITGSGGITLQGNGTLLLNNTANNFTGGIQINSGSLMVLGTANGVSAAGAGTITINGTGATLLASRIPNISTTTIWNPITLNTGFNFGGNGSLDGNFNNLTLNGPMTLAANATINVPNIYVTGQIGGVISGNFGITKDGPGVLVLNLPSYTGSLNNYTGGTTINNGVLRLGGANVIPNISRVTAATNGVLNLNAFSETVGSLAGAGNITNTGALATLTIGADNTTDANFSGVLSAITATNLSLTKIGSGKQALSGANTYTGTTQIDSGILQLGNGGTTGSLNPLSAITDNATLAFNRSDTITQGTQFNSVISGTGGITQIGSGTTVLNGANTYTGLTLVSAGTLSYGASNVIATGPVTVNGATAVLALGANQSDSVGTLTVDGGGSITGSGISSLTSTGTFEMKSGSVSAILAGGVALNKTTSGTATLSGVNTYTGITTVSAGTLAISGSPTGNSAMTISGGTLKLDYGTNITTKIHDSAVLTLGGGTLELAGGSHTEIVGSTTIAAGASAVTRTNGTSLLRMNVITRNSGGTVNFAVNDIASTSTANDASGILGTWATVGGTDWAVNSGVTEGGTNNYIRAYTGYTDIDAQAGGAAPNIQDASATNVRIQNDGFSGAIGLSAATTTVNSLLKNNANFATTVATAGQTLRVNGIMLNTVAESLTIGAAANDGTLTSATSAGTPDLTLSNSSVSKLLTVNAVIANNSVSSTLTKLGSGTVILAGANTYSGITTVNGGVLQIGDGGTTGSLGGGNVTNNGTLTFNRGDSITVGNVISGGGALIQNGAGTLTLGSANTFSGGTTISSGIITMAHNLALQNSTVDVGANNNALTFSAGITTPTVGALQGSGNLTLVTAASEAATLNAGGNGATTTFSGAINGAGGMVKSGSGTMVLAGTNTYAGTTTVSAGVLQIGNGSNTGSLGGGNVTNNGGLVFNRNNTISVNNVISGSGSLTQNGTGTLVLTGANTFVGAAILSAGTLSAATDANLGDTNALIFDGGALQVTGTTLNNFGPHTPVFNDGKTVGLDVANAGNIFTVSQILNQGTGGLTKSGPGTLVLTGTNTYSGTTTVNAGVLQVGNGGASGSLGSGNVTDNGILVFNTSSAVTLPGGIVGTGSLAQSGTGTLTLTGPNAYGGTTTLNTGTLSLGASTAIGTGTLIINGGALDSALPNLVNAGNNPQSWNADFTFAGTNSLNLGTGAVAMSATRTVNVSANTLTVGGSISGAGLIKTGSGTLLLSGVNTFAGAAILSAGTLSVGADTNLGSANGLTFDGGTLQITGTSLTSYAAGFIGSHAVTLTNGKTVSLDINNAANTFTISQILNQGSGGLTKLGAGTLVLTAANTYTGTTSLSAGVLQVGNGGSTGDLGSSNVVDNGSLIFNRSGAITVSNAISGTGSLTQAGPGTLTLTAANTYSGATTMSAGTLSVGADSNLGSGNALVFDGGALQITGVALNNFGLHTPTFNTGKTVGLDIANAGNIFTVSQILNQGGGGLAKLGAGTLVLTGTNTYSGITTVNAGILQIGDGSSTGNLGSGNVTNNTSLIFNSSGASTVSGVISGNGSLSQIGTGTVTLSGTNSYTGATTMSAGTLSVGADANLGNANPLIFNGGTLQVTGTALTSYAAGAIGSHPVTLTVGKSVGFDVSNAANTFTVNQVLNQGFGGLTKLGAGTLVLSGANTYTGPTTLSAGTLSVGADANLGNTNALIFDGGTLRITGTALTSYTSGGYTTDPIPVLLPGKIASHLVTLSPNKTVGFDIANAANEFIVSQPLNHGTGGLTKAGAGTLKLVGANSYTGMTTVDGGTLVLSASLSGAATVNNTGTLSGNNVSVGDVIVNSGGTLSPGVDGTGDLSTGTVTFNSGSIYQFQIDSFTPAIDFLNINGNLNIVSGAMMNVTDLGAMVLSGSVPIMTYTGVWNGGGFMGLADEAIFTVGLNAYQISYNGADGTTKEVTLTVVPEPGVAFSLLGGLGLLVGVRRRRVD